MEGGLDVETQISIIIPTYLRAHLLNWGLFSLAKQAIPFQYETIVINDGIRDETEEICKEYQERLNLKYLFSGFRNLNGETKWRVPGFAINIAAQKSKGEILIIACPEMFHINDTVAKLSQPVLDDKKVIAIPIGKDDQDGIFLNQVMVTQGNVDPNLFGHYPELCTRMPFLMAISRDEFLAIGGYDEDFTGIAFDDNDITDRLLLNGCRYYPTDAKAVHLYHPRYGINHQHPLWIYNQNLYYSRKGTIFRNQNKEWGKL